MPCNHVEPAKGHQKEKQCQKPELLNGYCAEHQPRSVSVAMAAVVPTWEPVKESGGTTVNEQFQDQCEAHGPHIMRLCDNGAQTGGMPFTGNKGKHQLLHDTQPHTNNVVFYRWVGNVMRVYGVGKHVGKDNKHYRLTWYDGSNASVDLPKKTIT
jgi:hypothetical protein